jgi:hypothetical protein
VNSGSGFLPLLYMAGCGVTYFFLSLTVVFAFFLRSHSPTLVGLTLLRLALLSCALPTEGSSVHFLTYAMACIKSTAHLIGPTTGAGGEGHGSEGLAERTASVALSDVGSHSEASGDMGERLQHTKLLFWAIDRDSQSDLRDDQPRLFC